MVSFDLTGKVAIVTGGSRGLGKDMATGLAQAGADLALLARNSAALEEAASEIRSASGRRVECVSIDLGDIEAGKAAVSKVLELFGKIDILVNNAAILERVPVDEVTPEGFDRMVGINLRAPYFLAQEVVRSYMKEHGGNIVNICSVAGFRASATSPMYPITKMAANMMTQCQAAAWAQYGIHVNGIAPGQMLLGMGETSEADWVAEMSARVPQRRLGTHDDLNGALIYLCSDACRYTQGQIICCDGGLLLPLR